MSYLLQRIVREELFTTVPETQIPKWLGEGLPTSAGDAGDGEWEHLCTDLGGEG